MADKLIGGLTPTAAVLLTDKCPKEPTAGPPAEYYLISQLKTLLDTIYAPLTGGAYVLKAGDTMTGLLTIAQATANTSNLILSGQSLTGANAQSLLSMTGTWNTSGNPVALRLAITNTASGATSKFLEFLAGAGGATSIFSIDKVGSLGWGADFVLTKMSSTELRMTTGANLNLAYMTGCFVVPDGSAGAPGLSFGDIGYASGVGFRRNGASIEWITAGIARMFFSLEGLSLFNGGQLNWSSTTAPDGAQDAGFSRNSAGVVEVNSGTTGTFRDIWARIVRTTPAFTVATLPAAGNAGSRTYVTNALAPAYGAAVAGGGAVVTSVMDNGTTWIVS